MKQYAVWALAALLILVGFLWFTTFPTVPFHPDESSLLYESQDFESLFQNPLTLSYSQGQPTTPKGEYRALNPPFAKYVLAIGRRLFGVGPQHVDVDWDWQLDWQHNLLRGALPSVAALMGARLASTVMAFLAIPLLYFAGTRLGGSAHGLVASLLYGLNAFVLLHGRRAMAEGTLLFTVSLLILLSFVVHRRTLAAGVAAGLAFSTKHSALPLLVMPVTGLLLQGDARASFRQQLTKIGLIIGGFCLTVLVLTPFLWRDPLGAVRASIKQRRLIVAQQVSLTDELAAGAVLDTPSERAASLIGNTLLLPLQFQEVGNYQGELAEAIGDYTNNFLHRLLVGPWQGSILFGLTLLGFWGGFRAPLFSSENRRRRHLILAVGTASLASALLLLNPLPYQRYYIPLLPMLILWQASGLLTLVSGIRFAKRKLNRWRS